MQHIPEYFINIKIHGEIQFQIHLRELMNSQYNTLKKP